MVFIRVTRLKAVFFIMAVVVLLCIMICIRLMSMANLYHSRAIASETVRFGTASKENLSSNVLEQNCQPVKYIYYLKTHKTASATLTSILYRYGDKQNLTSVMSLYPVGFKWPQRFHISNAYPMYEKPNLLCNHARYNKPLINWLFPRPKAKYITTLRNPVGHFESAFYFYDLKRHLKIRNNDPIKAFLDAPPKTFLHFRDTWVAEWSPLLYRVRNLNLFDLGLNHKYFLNTTAVQNYIDFIDREFDLVMIADHFDESLILLKQMFCWEVEDIVHYKFNVRKQRPVLQEEVKRKIEAWNWADGLLFNHFNKTLWNKIRLAGPGFHRDLARLRELNQYYQHICPLIINTRNTSQEQSELLHKCTKMSMGEFKFYYYNVQKYKKMLSHREASKSRPLQAGSDIDPFFPENKYELPADSLDFNSP